jgi:uncharacterized protein YjiS (DUF1127 family)
MPPTYIVAVKDRHWAGVHRKTTMSRNINSLYNRYRRWRRYRETVRELESLSTHELSDLGINRGEISRLAREASRL